jgi:Fe-S-cluster containining protein
MHKWAELLDITFPECNKTGHCCRCASPSVSVEKLFEKAKKGEDFARDFFSVFVPHKDINTAEKESPSVVRQSLELVNKAGNSEISINTIVFYKCRFILENHTCAIYEDRPVLCRTYPDSPFYVFSEDCSCHKWAIECKEKYSKMKQELKVYKEELSKLKYIQKINLIAEYLSINNHRDYKLMILLPSLSLLSPGGSWIRIF